LAILAYVAAFRKLATFRPQDGPDPFFRWLRAIAERKLTDAIRARRAAKRGGGRQQAQTERSSVVGPLQLVACDLRTPSRSVARQEAVLGIQAALERLPADYREALRLRYMEGLDVAETAERMRRGAGAVRTLCWRALRTLCWRAVRTLCWRALRQLELAIGDPAAFFRRIRRGPTPGSRSTAEIRLGRLSPVKSRFTLGVAEWRLRSVACRCGSATC